MHNPSLRNRAPDLSFLCFATLSSRSFNHYRFHSGCYSWMCLFASIRYPGTLWNPMFWLLLKSPNLLRVDFLAQKKTVQLVALALPFRPKPYGFSIICGHKGLQEIWKPLRCFPDNALQALCHLSISAITSLTFLVSRSQTKRTNIRCSLSRVSVSTGIVNK